MVWYCCFEELTRRESFFVVGAWGDEKRRRNVVVLMRCWIWVCQVVMGVASDRKVVGALVAGS